jgi:hypothetical protein
MPCPSHSNLREEVNIDSVLGLLHHVNVGDVADVSEVYTTSIFRVEVCKVCEFLCIRKILFFGKKKGVVKVGIGASCWPIGTLDRESCSAVTFNSHGVLKRKNRNQCFQANIHPSDHQA